MDLIWPACGRKASEMNDSGMMKLSPPISTVMPSRIASVSGRRIAMAVPTPLRERTSMLPPSALDVALDHIHAHPAAGDVAHLVGGGEAGCEHELPHLFIAHARVDVQAALLGLGQDLLAVEAAAVVVDFHQDAAALVHGAQLDRAAPPLAGRFAQLRGLDAMIHGVAHQMQQRVRQLLDDLLVEFRLTALRGELYLLAETLRQVAYQCVACARRETRSAAGGCPSLHLAARASGALRMPRCRATGRCSRPRCVVPRQPAWTGRSPVRPPD